VFAQSNDAGNEIAFLQHTAAESFLTFEASLPENSSPAPDLPTPDEELTKDIAIDIEDVLDMAREVVRFSRGPWNARGGKYVKLCATLLRQQAELARLREEHEALKKDKARLRASLEAMQQDAARWNRLKALVAENHMHKGLGGGIVLASAPANDDDAAWASVQAIDHENPRNTIWISEAQSLDAAIDASPVARTSVVQGSL
jgi:hypothetical protein